MAELLGVPSSDSQVSRDQVDAIVQVAGYHFVVEWKSSGAAAPVASGAEQVRRAAESLGYIPLLAVPFMGPEGRRMCRAAGVGWLDLSGNAEIRQPGLNVFVEGKPNRYRRPGRPSTAFAPKSSRIARWLLLHPGQPMAQRELARATEMDEGYTSRVVARLEADGLVSRRQAGLVEVEDPGLLLDAWSEAYDFGRHRILRGHMAARSGEAGLRQAAGTLRESGVSYAATGLAAAWLLDRFAGFRIVTLYLAQEPAPALLDALGFREDERGANTWLAVPNDEGVFHGAGEQEGVRCVHPVQAYLDLLAHPERAPEAAERLRAKALRWPEGG